MMMIIKKSKQNIVRDLCKSGYRPKADYRFKL